MDKLKALFVNYWPALLSVLLLAVVVYIIYRAGKKDGTGNYTVVDDQGNIVNPTPVQNQTAESIATRIHTDLNSGVFFGYNVLGSVGRDDEAYAILANMSDSLFALTADAYHRLYVTSLVADIKAETSLPTGGIGTSSTPKDQILAKAARLNIN